MYLDPSCWLFGLIRIFIVSDNLESSLQLFRIYEFRLYPKILHHCVCLRVNTSESTGFFIKILAEFCNDTDESKLNVNNQGRAQKYLTERRINTVSQIKL